MEGGIHKPPVRRTSRSLNVFINQWSDCASCEWSVIVFAGGSQVNESLNESSETQWVVKCLWRKGSAELLLGQANRQAGTGKDGVDLDCYGLGRLSRGSLLRWFSRARRLGRPTTNPIGRIDEATGATPLLVRHFDPVLLNYGIGAENTSEEEVSDEDFRNALERRRADVPLLARRLISDAPALRLESFRRRRPSG